MGGTLVAVHQPEEESGDGAQAGVDDGLADVVGAVDLAVARHVLALRAGPSGRVSVHPRCRGQHAHYGAGTWCARLALADLPEDRDLVYWFVPPAAPRSGSGARLVRGSWRGTPYRVQDRTGGGRESCRDPRTQDKNGTGSCTP